MIRKTGYLGLGVVLGAAAAVSAPQALLFVSPSAYAAAADTYRQLNLFGDVFDKIRNDYVEKPDEVEADRGRDQRHAHFARPAFELHGRQGVPRHAGPDEGRIRRPRHRGDAGGRAGQGRDADRRYACRQGGRDVRRHHQRDRRPVDAGPDARSGGRQDARLDQLAGEAQNPPRPEKGGQGLHHRPRSHPRPVRALACRGRRHRLHPHHPVHRADRRWPEGRHGEAAQRDSGRQVQGLYP